MSAVFPLLMILLACIGIMYACNLFEQASDYLGRNMGPGVKGATINAIGSSLPELFTTFILLFFYRDVDGFTGGVATTAGSAVFNAVLIPAGAILAVTVWKMSTTSIELDKQVLRRDGFFVILAELALIFFLGSSTMYWWMGLALMSIYGTYFAYLMYQNSQHEPEEEEDDEYVAPGGFFTDLWNGIRGEDIGFVEGLYQNHGGYRHLTARAWTYLLISIMTVGAFCHLLAESTVQLAEIWNVPLFITTVVFAAAATSVPDTIISIKDALKGEYEDAVANAIGSNIFDVCFSLGFPLFIYGLVVGPVDLQGGHEVQVLRWVMLGFTMVVLAMFYRGKVGRGTGFTMVAMYGGWLGYIAYSVLA
jgi:cation:H+ antiporter